MKNRQISFLLAALLAVSALASCGDKNPSSTDTSAQSGGDSTTAQEKPEYEFTTEYDGSEIRVLNCDDIFSMHARVDTGETNGETLNDAQYNAVRKLEDNMGIKWVETNVHLQNEMPDQIRQLILAGDDDYDIIYQSYSQNYYEFTSQGYYYNLNDYSGIQLDKPWWLSSFNDLMEVNGKLYAGLGYSHLCTIDAAGILAFNQSMMEKLSLELPYESVKNGTWTIDKLITYCKSAADLNGDESFTWKADGNCVWGLSAPSNIGANRLENFGQSIIINENGKLKLNAGSERFYDGCTMLSELFSANDGSVCLAPFNGDDKPESYIGVFENQRALFGCSEVAKSNRLRKLDFDFGVLPYPKLDEEQDRYYASLSFPACGVAIPVTCQTPERSAAVGDAINYIFYKDVWPVFRSVTLEQKNMRNEESIEMLDIILNSTAPIIYDVYTVGNDYVNALSDKIRKGDTGFSSLLASYADAINEKIAEVNEN